MNPAEVVLNGSMLIAIPLALLAGVITFASPCVLPLVPGYLGYVSGAATTKTKVVFGSILFVLGFTAVFVPLGVLAAGAGLIFVAQNQLVQILLGALVVLFGFVLIGQFGPLQKTFKLPISPRVGLLGAPLLGVVFALGWTPCIGPTLSAVLVLASDTGDPIRGGVLATVYSLGLGLPFIALAAGFSWATKSVAFVKRHLRAFNLFGGSVLILIGLLIMTGIWNRLMLWVQEVVGGYTVIL